MILAADVGATKVLVEAGDIDEGRWKPFLARRYAIADYGGMAAVLEQFLGEWAGVKPARARLVSAAIGVAGPAEGNVVKMTHRPWIVDGDALARRFEIPRIAVVNDLHATASGIEMLSPRDFHPLQSGRAVEGAPQGVLGVGTGLGIAYKTGVRHHFPPAGKVVSDTSFMVVPGEGGHMGFSPASAEQAHVWRVLFERHGRVEAEDVASGRGIAQIHQALTGRLLDTAEICDDAFGRGDKDALRTMDLFAECLGNIAGDHALATMARGGIHLAGGVMAKVARQMNREKFAAAFCAKGAMSAMMMRIPVRAVVNDRLAILGAAALAQRKNRAV